MYFSCKGDSEMMKNGNLQKKKNGQWENGRPHLGPPP